MKVPDGLPELGVELNGVALPPQHLRSIASVRVQQRLSVPTLCEIILAEPDQRIESEVAPGNALRVRVGQATDPLFDGQVTAVEYAHGPSRPRELRIRSYDVLHQLRKRQAIRAHIQVTLADLARELTRDLGLRIEIGAAGPLWRHIIQNRQSDFELLADLAARCGIYLTAHAGTLQMMTLEGMGGTLQLILGESLLEANIEVNAEPSCRSVVAAGWDVRDVTRYRGRASRPRVGRKVTAEVPPSRVGGTGERALADEPLQADAHAEAAAQAELDYQVAREVVLRGVADGDVRLRPGARVQVRGVASQVTGTYVLTSTTHLLDTQHGFITEICSAPPPRKPRRTAASTALGLISSVDGLTGRVKATLPTYGDVETDWMQVAAVGAGAGKGLAMLPDVGDSVLLLFAHEDPGEGIVVSGLYGSHNPKDTGVENGAVRRYTLLTAGGQTLSFDDKSKSLKLTNGAGSSIELSPKNVRIRSAVPLVLEAPGQPITIKAQSVNFKRE